MEQIEYLETEKDATIILEYNISIKDGSNVYEGIYVKCSIE